MNFLTHWYIVATQHPVDTAWTSVGFLGQAVFGVRFLIQWLRSEQEGHSVVPIVFWYFSLVGGLISFSYAVHIAAWPLVVGQGMPIPIYARNLYMILRDRARARGGAETQGSRSV